MIDFKCLHQFARFPFPVADVVEEGKDPKVFSDAQIHRQIAVSGREVAALQDLRAMFGDIETEEADRAGGRSGQSEEDMDRGRFSCAICAEEADDFAWLDFK